ncbi:hypothetical protein BKA70DRAFT_1231217 [Coprinopsis sp. MPI-PUGE-AT-0042]|nr:hypothetical protein BKA70DRAFT_1231217 [Coprinopsis sp. MPI-PUGE-AT-0042]
MPWFLLSSLGALFRCSATAIHAPFWTSPLTPSLSELVENIVQSSFKRPFYPFTSLDVALLRSLLNHEPQLVLWENYQAYQASYFVLLGKTGSPSPRCLLVSRWRIPFTALHCDSNVQSRGLTYTFEVKDGSNTTRARISPTVTGVSIQEGLQPVPNRLFKNLVVTSPQDFTAMIPPKWSTHIGMHFLTFLTSFFAVITVAAAAPIPAAPAGYNAARVNQLRGGYCARGYGYCRATRRDYCRWCWSRWLLVTWKGGRKS